MTMVKIVRTIGAGEFKAKCLALLDEVSETGLPIVVSKHGIPVARLVPIEEDRAADLRGSVRKEGDLVSPIGDSWDAE